MTDQHISDLIPGYALDCLDETEFDQAKAHLALCPLCRAELASYQAVVDRLGMAAPDVTCSDDLKHQLIVRVHPAVSAVSDE